MGGGLPSALNSDQLKVSDSAAATKLGTIETDIEATNTKLTSIETDIEATNTKLDSILTKLDAVGVSGNVNVQGNRIDNGANSSIRCSAAGSFLIDTEASGDLITTLTAIKTAVESLNTKLSASNTSGHYGNA